MNTQTQPQTSSSASNITGILVLLRAKAGVTREKVMPFMPAEIRATVQLYLNGLIRDWYSRADGKGVVFILNTDDISKAEALVESLPLSREHLMDHEFIAIGPLMPLRLLLAAKEPG